MAKKIKFNFGFGLKAGLNGANGRDGLDGSNGVNGRDGVDGIGGRDGLDGTSARFRYAKTADKDTIPPVVFDNINPGSIWGAVIPMYNSPEAVWMIQADVNPNNTLKSNWVGPVRVTGIDGLDGVPVLPPNYNISVFKQSETLPAKPTYNHIDAEDKEGWVTYPNMSSGTWWESIGRVEGVSDNILSWSEPIRKTPIDPTGEIGQDGNSIEKRRVYHQSSIDAPSVDRNLRTPPGWVIDLGTPPPGNYYVWEITASIKPDDSLNGQWSTPYRLTGKEGDGSPVPEYRWAVNTSLVEHPPIDVDARIPGVAWSTTIPVIEEDDHVWETMALINDDDTLYSVWHPPVRKTGAEGPVGATGPIGERGPTGSNGTSGIPGVSYENRFSLGTEENFQATFNGTVAGTRNPSGSGWSMTIPTTTEAFPQIWQIQARIQRATNEDPSGALEGVWSVPFKITGTNGLPGNNGYSQIAYPQGTYSNTATYTTTTRTAPYVLDPLDGNFYIMNFIGSWNGQSQNNISPSQDYANNGGQFWQLIQAHEAIYTKLLISPNGLLGEAVFNQQYMFSQTGVNSSGTHSSNYELFNPAIPTGGAFTPNMMINFANGEARFARGNIVLGSNGTINISNGKHIFNTNGSAEMAGGNLSISSTGSVKITGKFESNSSGNKIVIDPAERELYFLDGATSTRVIDMGFNIPFESGTASSIAFKEAQSANQSQIGPSFMTIADNSFYLRKRTFQAGFDEIRLYNGTTDALFNVKTTTAIADPELAITMRALTSTNPGSSLPDKVWRDGSYLRIGPASGGGGGGGSSSIAWADVTNKPSTFAPSAHSHAWAAITNKPSTFTPSAHNHAISDVTNLQTSLNSKLNTSGGTMTGNLTVTTVSFGNGWTIESSGTELQFKQSGTLRARMTSSGFVSTGEVTAFS